MPDVGLTLMGFNFFFFIGSRNTYHEQLQQQHQQKQQALEPRSDEAPGEGGGVSWGWPSPDEPPPPAVPALLLLNFPPAPAPNPLLLPQAADRDDGRLLLSPDEDAPRPDTLLI